MMPLVWALSFYTTIWSIGKAVVTR